MSEKNYLKDTDEILRLADDNSNLNTILEEDYQASESEMAWYQALLTEQMGLLRYVRTD